MTYAFMSLLAAAGLIRWAPDLPLSRILHRWLAERPATWLSRRTRQELIAWAIVAALLAFAGEYVLLIGGPQMAISLAVDLAAYVDAVIAVATLASVARAQAVARWVGPRLARRSRPSGARAQRIRRERSAANDSEDRPARFAA